MKKCTQCCVAKDESEFNKRWDGKLRGQCRPCRSENMKSWRRRNPEKARSAHRRQHYKDLERTRAQKRESMRRHYHKNAEKIKENVRQWRLLHPEKKSAQNAARRARKRGNGGKYTGDEWIALKKHYDYRCLACKRRKKLTPDHVIPLAKGGSNSIANIQPLCVSCNSKKGTNCTDYRPKSQPA